MPLKLYKNYFKNCLVTDGLSAPPVLLVVPARDAASLGEALRAGCRGDSARRRADCNNWQQACQDKKYKNTKYKE